MGDAIFEIRPAAGGSEASLFAVDILNMIQKYAELKSWTFEVVDISETDIGGLRDAVCSISGSGVFGSLKFESGVHRVQRIPKTESAGRIHTSTITVAVLPQASELQSNDISPKDLKIEVFRAGGAGGQHVNKTESAVRLTHIPTGLTASSQSDRSQHRNKKLAMQILKSKLIRLEKSKLNVERDASRKQQIGTGERFERIRTYNFPQDRVTDHRLNESFFGIERVLSGETLMDMHEKLISQEQENALLQVLSDDI
eukprot:TRINITY_DN3855_c0_g1_i1.p1 TRINITY_DN3855_c0_g1~~TRINITY_DN3855_c0_g1_i1.p1  ORF type:complete len:256 (+),score=41.90 TRINITY_DN3855_c0_g1_i1:504-1271(+)